MSDLEYADVENNPVVGLNAHACNGPRSGAMYSELLKNAKLEWIGYPPSQKFSTEASRAVR